MNFSIAIYSDPLQSTSAASAFKFACETLNQGHSIYRLFFFNDGVMNCADTKKGNNKDWQQLIEAHQLDAIVCMASAQKRGLLQASDTAKHESTRLIHSSFTAGGIAQLIDASVQSDRLISFGG